LIERFIGRAIDAADRTALVNALGGGTVGSTTPTLRQVVGIVTASPYAQWR